MHALALDGVVALPAAAVALRALVRDAGLAPVAAVGVLAGAAVAGAGGVELGDGEALVDVQADLQDGGGGGAVQCFAGGVGGGGGVKLSPSFDS